MGLLCSAGVEGKEKSTGDGGGAGVSLTSCVERDAMLEALKAALTSWPRVELVRMERRWRGLAVDWWTGIVTVVDVLLVVVVVEVMLEAAVAEEEMLESRWLRGGVCSDVWGCQTFLYSGTEMNL